MNDRGDDKDDKIEGHEDTEYHFSDEDISYEVESETPKPAAPAAAPTGSKENIMARIMGSKRIIISGAVFILLIFVVYKMVSPSSSQSNEITPIAQTAPAAQPTAASPAVAPQTEQAAAMTPAAATTAPAAMQQPAAAPAPATMTAAAPAQVAQTAAPQAAAPTAMPTATAQAGITNLPPPGAAMTATQPVAAAPTVAQQPAQMLQQPIQTTVAQAPASLPPPGAYEPQPGTVASQPQTAAMGQVQTATQPTMQQQPATTAVASMPAVIPVQSPVVQVNQGAMPETSQQPVVTVQPAGNDTMSKLANMEADTERLIGQMQAGNAQKLNDFATQNKALQEQVQSLNSKMAVMESQLSQLISALTRQGPAPEAGVSGRPPAPDVRTSSYNVQAIIPGRAWLRAENGETLTVAEGDMIKDLGKVTKIDPYDGIVEINTGTKVVSLSYGNGG